MATSAAQNAKELSRALCEVITGSADGGHIDVCHQGALRLLGSFHGGATVDEFTVCEGIKKFLVKQGRPKESVAFSEAYVKLKSKGTLKQVGSVLKLLLRLAEEAAHAPSSTINLFRGYTLAAEALPPGAHAGLPPRVRSARGGDQLLDSSRSSGVSSVASSSLFRAPHSDRTLLPSSSDSAASNTTVQVGGRELVQSGRHRPGSLPIATSGHTVLPSSASLELSKIPVVAYHREGKEDLPEPLLLRSVLYALQGIDSDAIKYSTTNGALRLTKQVGASKPRMKLVNRVLECGWLYIKVNKYAEARSNDKGFGQVGQSFCAALRHELMEYYRLIAVLESQQEVTAAVMGSDDSLGYGSGGDSGDSSALTLRRLSVWTFDPCINLRVLASLVDACKSSRGGELASVIHSYLRHGDPQRTGLVRHLLTVVTQPLYDTVLRWIHDGLLNDPHHEFFVAAAAGVKDELLWHDKYSLRKSMVPAFLTMDQASKILLTGKSINFLRHVCHDNTQIKTREAVQHAQASGASCMFTQDSDGEFQRMISAVYRETSRHLLHVFCIDYKFMDHLKAMRRYLLLGQGDFIRHLMDLLEEELGKPANTLYVHNLAGVLETAVRATNAQYDDADILKRLDVRRLDVSPGDQGWDVFSLDYHVDGPISTVFTAECVTMYLRVFNFLWRAKRVEYALANVFKQLAHSGRVLRNVREASTVLRQAHFIASEMIHFIRQVGYYINFEVLECSWDELLQKVNKAEDLDHVIEAHQAFLDSIVARCLLNEGSREILTQLRAVFDRIVSFQNIVGSFFAATTLESQATADYSSRQHRKAEKGQWSRTDANDEREKQRRAEFVQKTLKPARTQLKVLAQSYQEMLKKLLVMLASHVDESLRFLSFRLDFNEHYRDNDVNLQRSPHGFPKKVPTPRQLPQQAKSLGTPAATIS